MTTNPSITSTKTAFLRSQIRLLSSRLQPSPTWADLTTNPAPDDEAPAPLPPKTTDDLVSKVDSKISAHNRLVFSAPSQRHVAEQIDALYWNDVVGATDTRDAQTIWIAKDADLSEGNVLRELPAGLEELVAGRGNVLSEDQVRQYGELREKAVMLAEKREELRRRVEGYRWVRELLAPFENVKRDVQPNLVTKDGELSRELERMRVLIARVEAGVGEGIDGERDEDHTTQQLPATLSDQERVERVMELG